MQRALKPCDKRVALQVEHAPGCSLLSSQQGPQPPLRPEDGQQHYVGALCSVKQRQRLANSSETRHLEECYLHCVTGAWKQAPAWQDGRTKCACTHRRCMPSRKKLGPPCGAVVLTCSRTVIQCLQSCARTMIQCLQGVLDVVQLH